MFSLNEVIVYCFVAGMAGAVISLLLRDINKKYWSKKDPSITLKSRIEAEIGPMELRDPTETEKLIEMIKEAGIATKVAVDDDSIDISSAKESFKLVANMDRLLTDAISSFSGVAYPPQGKDTRYLIIELKYHYLKPYLRQFNINYYMPEYMGYVKGDLIERVRQKVEVVVTPMSGKKPNIQTMGRVSSLHGDKGHMSITKKNKTYHASVDSDDDLNDVLEDLLEQSRNDDCDTDLEMQEAAMMTSMVETRSSRSSMERPNAPSVPEPREVPVSYEAPEPVSYGGGSSDTSTSDD